MESLLVRARHQELCETPIRATTIRERFQDLLGHSTLCVRLLTRAARIVLKVVVGNKPLSVACVEGTRRSTQLLIRQGQLELSMRQVAALFDFPRPLFQTALKFRVRFLQQGVEGIFHILVLIRRLLNEIRDAQKELRVSGVSTASTLFSPWIPARTCKPLCGEEWCEVLPGDGAETEFPQKPVEGCQRKLGRRGK